MDSTPYLTWLRARVSFASRLAALGDYQNHRCSIEKSFEADGIGYLEVSDGFGAFTSRRVYSAKDRDGLCRVLKLASKRWPSKNSLHQRFQTCWRASPCIAIREWWDGALELRTSPLYIQTGCGDIKTVMNQVEQKLYFVRQHGLDAFIAWIARSDDDHLPF